MLERCKSTTGSADCLTVKESPPVPAEFRDHCWIDTLSYADTNGTRVKPVNQGERRTVPAGTVVVVTTTCIDAFVGLEGKPLTALDAGMVERCGTATGGDFCLTVNEVPPVVDAAQRSACTVGTVSYLPEAAVAGGRSVLKQGTVVTVTTACPAG
jgi:hypothetical protein